MTMETNEHTHTLGGCYREDAASSLQFSSRSIYPAALLTTTTARAKQNRPHLLVSRHHFRRIERCYANQTVMFACVSLLKTHSLLLLLIYLKSPPNHELPHVLFQRPLCTFLHRCPLRANTVAVDAVDDDDGHCHRHHQHHQ